jgi:hypothetical protein
MSLGANGRSSLQEHQLGKGLFRGPIARSASG